MRQIVFGVLSTLVCLTFGLRTVYAQGSGVDMSTYITLTVKQGATIKLDFAASTSGVKVKVDGVKNPKEVDARTYLLNSDDQPQYEAQGTEIKVYGNIVEFSCHSNEANLTALDLSKNEKLTVLRCYKNQLSSLDLSKHDKLINLDCSDNQLSSLDVSKLGKLKYFFCNKNQLTNLKLGESGQLENLDCGDNRLSSLDVSKNGNLKSLNCKKNQLSSLNVSENKKLEDLDCSGNQLPSLDVSKNDALESLDCSGNQLSSIEVSKNRKLKSLTCSHNKLSSIVVNTNYYLADLGCASNQLSDLDVTKNDKLISLNCSDNQLSSLNLSGNKELTQLKCSYNPLSSLDLSENKQLENIWLYGNNFSTSILNSIYCQLPDRTGKAKGFIYPVYEKGDVDALLAKSTSKSIIEPKNWVIQYWESDEDIEDITGNQTCGSTYALTLEPAAMSKFFPYQGGEWKTTVTSSGSWKLDETTSLPDWLKVEPKQGNTGVQVTITVVLPNKKDEVRSGAIAFVLANDAKTKQVVLLTQEKRPDQYITVDPLNYIFPTAGEKKENCLTVESSAAWTLSYNADWLKVETKEGAAGEKKLTITADPNSNKDARMAELTFAHKDNNDNKQVVTLKQEGKPAAVEEALFADVTVSPNPFHHLLRITNGNLQGEYTLLNAQGVKVASGVLEVSETTVNTSELSAGIYLLQLNVKGGATKTYRVVK